MRTFLNFLTVVIISVSSCGLQGCVTSGVLSASKSVGFDQKIIKTKNFDLIVLARLRVRGEPLVIYIEGDGRAWRTKYQLSQDPTPRDPVAFRLAAMDPGPNVAYLARPGQYVLREGSVCASEYWAGKRFSIEVIDSMNEAVDVLKKDAGAIDIHLIGYSGGGAIAVLLASKRTDISELRTVAGNLDHDEVCRIHNVDSLSGSLNAIDVAQDIKNIPQRHFAGEKDKVVPDTVTRKFAAKMGDVKNETVTVLKGADHHSIKWVNEWQELLKLPLITAAGQSQSGATVLTE